MMRFALAALAMLLLPGCLSCEPQLEVRNCLDRQCDPSDDALMVTWNETLEAEWPELATAMATTPLGEHHHAVWPTERENEFWDAWRVTGDEKELIITKADERFRVRVLSCD